MRFVKASERLPEDNQDKNLFLKWIWGGNVIMGVGRYFGRFVDGHKGSLDIREDQIEWLDESPPASAVEEAAKMYPLEDTAEKGEAGYMLSMNELIDIERSAHITCAGMYTDTIDKLKAEIVELKKEVFEWKSICHEHNLP